MALITCQNVSMGYEGKKVIDDISFNVHSGDYLGIVGENGSGKTTLMKGILKLKNTMSGSIVFGEGLLPREIGYLPQQSAIQSNFPASIFEVVISGRINKLGIRPYFNHQDKENALEKMELLGISHMRNWSFQELSGGQRQRVLLARALCATTKLLLLDEPIAGLDPIVSANMYEMIDEINKKHGITVIMISHDIEATIRYASHILHLGSDTYFYGTTKEYLNVGVSKAFVGGACNA